MITIIRDQHLFVQYDHKPESVPFSYIALHIYRNVMGEDLQQTTSALQCQTLTLLYLTCGLVYCGMPRNEQEVYEWEIRIQRKKDPEKDLKTDLRK